MKIELKAATLAALRYINREDLIVQDSYSVFEQVSDYIRSLYPAFNDDEIETCTMLAMKLTIS